MDFEVPQIELWPVEQLVPYARNSKKHSDEQIALIMGAMLEFGYTNPVLADKSGIVAGHGRTMAVTRLYEAGKSIRFPGGVEIPHGQIPVIKTARVGRTPSVGLTSSLTTAWPRRVCPGISTCCVSKSLT